MAKPMKRARVTVKQQEVIAIPLVILKGIMASLGTSIMLTTLLSIAALVVESTFVDRYLSYIMVAITMASIFVGSVYAAQKVGSKGLVIGAAVGALYVLISVGIGMEINQETISLLVLANKFAAGMAVGALGGLLGVNL